MRTIVLACFALGLAACSPDAAPQPEAEQAGPVEPVIHTYRELGGQALSAHVFSPANSPSEPTSAVLIFHGGGWSVGAPTWMYDSARRFADHGMVAMSIQYRLSEGDVTPIEALADVCAAFRWARENASDFGIDPDRVAGYGVSAGGHLVTSSVTTGCPGDDASTTRATPDALLLWSPALDLAHDGWFERKLQGRAPVEAYSPVEHVRASTPPTSIVQGDADTLTPLSGAERYCARLTDFGTACELNVYEGVGHLLTRNLEYQEGDFDPDPEAVAAGVSEHLEFLREQGYIADAQ